MDSLTVNEALNDQGFKMQIANWGQQEKEMRRQLREWWTSHGETFGLYWTSQAEASGSCQVEATKENIDSISTPTIDPEAIEETAEESQDIEDRLLICKAMVITAVEEGSSEISVWSGFEETVCPELFRLRSLSVANDSISSSSSSSWFLHHTWFLLQRVIAGTENSPELFDQELIFSVLSAQSDQFSSISRPRFAVKALALMRSCFFLNFFLSVAHCWLTFLDDL